VAFKKYFSLCWKHVFFKPSDVINSFLLLLVEAYEPHMSCKQNTNGWWFIQKKEAYSWFCLAFRNMSSS